MPTPVRITTQVLPGNRIEVDAPGLTVGQTVEVLVLPARGITENHQGILELLDSLPSSSRTAEQWAAMEAEFQQERGSWDR